MIPLQLTLQGLYSYQDAPQTIDFRPLTSAQIFGIFGATGSGKSSILEAISYALYGKTERLSHNDRIKYNMMNLRSNRLFIDFQFASEEKEYRFTVQAQRSRKRFEDVGSPERNAYIKEKEDWLPIKVQSVEEILGLSYDNFKRTIIIPQGKFEEFLQMSNTDRTRMLKQIFRLEKYELWDKSASLDKKNLLALNAQETLLNQLEEVTKEHLAATREELLTIESQLQLAQQEFTNLDKQIRKWESLKERQQELLRKGEELKTLQAEEGNYVRREEFLRRYEVCLSTFQPLILERNKLSDSLELLTKSRDAKQQTAQELAQGLAKTEETFKSVKQQYLERDELRKKAEDLEKIINLKEVHQGREAANNRIKNGLIHVDLTRKKIDSLEGRKEELSQAIKTSQDQLPDFKALMAVKEWLLLQTSLKKEFDQASQALSNQEGLLQQLNQKKVGILKDSILEPAQYPFPLKRILSILLTAENSQREALLSAEDTVRQLSAQDQLKDLAQALESGQACPLCGSTHHPEVQAFEHLEDTLKSAQQRLAELQADLRQQEELRAEISSLQEVMELREQEVLTAREEVQKCQTSQDQHEARFSWESYRQLSPEALAEEIHRLESMAEVIRSLEQDREVVEQSMKKERENHERYQRKVDTLREDHHSLDVQFKGGVESLHMLSFEQFQGQENFNLEQRADQSRRDYEGIEDLYEQTEKKVQGQRSNLDSLKGEIDVLDQQATDHTRKLAQQVKTFSEALEASEFHSAPEVESLLQTPLSPQEERNQIARFRQSLKSTREDLAKLEEQLKGKEFDQEKFQALQAELQNKQTAITETTRQQGGLQTNLRRLEEQWKEKQKILKEVDRLRHRAENIKLMKGLFMRSGFVNYVSTIYLQHLCQAANTRFRKLTRGALSLETAEDNHFLVRDFLHNGQARSVKTLSGGQTFQAALSLALALAEQVQQHARSNQNFFFIDEGFGSQDKDSLEVIFETLKALRRENRIVGVISHVEDLQQEIETFLQISNDPESGSHVRGSWE